MFKKMFFLSILFFNINAFGQTNCTQNSSDSSCITTSSTNQNSINSNPNPNAPIINSCQNNSNQDSTCLSNPKVPNSISPTILNNNSNTYTRNCKNSEADSTCFESNILLYQNSGSHSLPICNNTNPGYYQNTQPPGGCLYKAPPTCIGDGVTPATWNSSSDSWSACGYIEPPQCSAGQTQTIAPYWDTLNDTWNGLQCQNPPPPPPPPAKPTCPQGQTQTSAPTWNGSSWVGLQCTAPPSVISVTVQMLHTRPGTTFKYHIVCSNGKTEWGTIRTPTRVGAIYYGQTVAKSFCAN